MCIFSPSTPLWPDWLIAWGRSAPRVADTRIFARVEDDMQWLVYQMRVGTPSDVAMILPVPVVPGSGDDALLFIDLSGYQSFFEDLAWLFPEPQKDEGNMLLSAEGPSTPPEKLFVHAVGSFEASYVPTHADFSRLDPRFRLPEAVWNALPQYADWSFAVFQLKKGLKKRIHPMAFRFPTRYPSRIFFPTVHVHDGQWHPTASFDHALYYQPPNFRGVDPLSSSLPKVSIDPSKACGVVDLYARVGRRLIRGTHDNADTWVDVAAGNQSIGSGTPSRLG